MEKLHGLFKFMMQTMKKTVGQNLEKKEHRTPDEDDMLNLLLHGGNLVSDYNLEKILLWCNEQRG